VRDLGTQLIRRSREDRERPVMDRDDVLDAEQLGGDRGAARAYRVVAADRQERQFRRVQLADAAQVAEGRSNPDPGAHRRTL
jgi:hypothetical protein